MFIKGIRYFLVQIILFVDFMVDEQSHKFLVIFAIDFVEASAEHYLVIKDFLGIASDVGRLYGNPPSE